MRLLIIEDEPALASSLERGLRHLGFAVDVATDGASGLEKGLVNDYDVVLLDRDLPRIHGDDVCAQLISAKRSARILMLTAASTLDDLVEGFSLGADDYLAKPFQFADLVARIQALLRRTGSPTSIVLPHGDIEVDAGRAEARRGGQLMAVWCR